MVYKGCPRCNGDLFEEEFLGGSDLVCLQCGYRQAMNVALGHEEGTRLVRWLQSSRPSKAA